MGNKYKIQMRNFNFWVFVDVMVWAGEGENRYGWCQCDSLSVSKFPRCNLRKRLQKAIKVSKGRIKFYLDNGPSDKIYGADND
jgi:hypothetical protein